ncbi:unnamed protein product, partial [Durusdinium trenchii]
EKPDNENFSQNKKEIVTCFEHIEKILKVNFTDHDEVIVKRDQAESEKKRAKNAKDDDEDVEMEDIDLPEETTPGRG